MDSGTLSADNLREKHRWGDGNKVYTRKFRNKGVNKINTINTPAAAAAPAIDVGATVNGNGNVDEGRKDDISNTTAIDAGANANGNGNVDKGTNDEISNITAIDAGATANGNGNVDKGTNDEISNTTAIDADVNANGNGNGDKGTNDVISNTTTDKNCEPPSQQSPQALATVEVNSPHHELQQQQQQQEKNLSRTDVVSDGSSSHNRLLHANVGESVVKLVKPVVSRIEDRVKINLAAANSKYEFRNLRRKLASEVDQVRALVKRLEAKESELTAFDGSGAPGGSRSHSQQSVSEANEMINGRALVRVNSEMQSTNDFIDNRRPLVIMDSEAQQHDDIDRRALFRVHSEVGSANDVIERRGLMRVHSEVGSVVHHNPRPFRHLSVSVIENNHNHGVGEYIEREKRTPKANQFYLNSDFLLGKDRLPPESKKSKSSSGRKHGGDMEYGFGMDKYRSQVFRSCSNLLQRLMKHKHGWVFNEPVNAKALGLHDYHDIIKHPMDLGTVKSRLSQNFYKSAREFAEDVRLTFRNAMTYNPKGQDVHVMAELLSTIFEERWAAMEVEYNTELRYDTIHDLGLPTPTSRKAPPHPLTPQMRTYDRWESMTPTVNSRVRMPVPKKPKAKDPNKRDMTYEEKQRLSTNLQSLPSEKLDNIVQIIKKGSSDLCQHDDEIEVDIDSVNAETLWELDRFVTNYKKGLSKSKRKAEIAKARAEAHLAMQAMNPTPAVLDTAKESVTGEMIVNTSHVQGEKQRDNASMSSSSSSSSSDSSSSDSDSDSSSGSDAGVST